MTLAPIRRQASLVDEVCRRLSDEIRTELADAGGWLPPERELAGRLGVSRPVVREAAKRLELQGLVEIQHGVGIRMVDKLHKPLNGSLELLVRDDAERLRQLNETRLAIEPEAARLAAARIRPAQLRRLRAIQAELENAPDIPAAIAADMAFHRAMAEASGNLMFRLILDSLAEIGLASRLRTIGRVGKQTAIEHHRAIIEAIATGKEQVAQEAMRQHILAAGDDMNLPVKRRAKRS